MDPLTHAASGAVAMLAMRRRPATAWAPALAALACASPDLDLLFIHGPLEFLLLHRGISHSLAAAPVFGLLLALCCRPLWRKSTPDSWKFPRVWLFCACMIPLHIWLDIVTTYGTMIFLPFSDYRVRLNSICIIDPLVTLPLLYAIWRWRARHALLLLTLGWIFLYPALGIALNAWHTSQTETRLAAEGRRVSRLHVLPDAFAPFFWRVIFEQDGLDGPSVRCQSLNALGQPRAPENVYPAAPAELVKKLSADSLECQTFFRFALLPVMRELHPRFIPLGPSSGDNASYVLFHDLRFGSDLAFARKLLAMRPESAPPFLMMVELFSGEMDYNGESGELPAGLRPVRVRLRFSDSGLDSGWRVPIPPRKPDFPEWLAGLN